MSAVALFFLIFLLSKKDGATNTPTLQSAANAAQADARAKTDRANATGHPAHKAEAHAAQHKAAKLSQAARAVAATPPPWPAATPNGLPPFPSGWVPDNPPPKAVQDRAWALLPALWKQGANARKTEQTAGRWITYVAQAMGKKKGVVAYRIRPGAEAPASPPVANA